MVLNYILVGCPWLLLVVAVVFRCLFLLVFFSSILYLLLLASYLLRDLRNTYFWQKYNLWKMPDSLFFHYSKRKRIWWCIKNFHVGNVQFMQNCQYITTVNQSQGPVECSGVHDVERLSVSKRFEFICINSVRRPFKGNANSKNILREGTHLCDSKIQKCKGSTQCRILNRQIPKVDWEWWANPVWNISRP